MYTITSKYIHGFYDLTVIYNYNLFRSLGQERKRPTIRQISLRKNLTAKLYGREDLNMNVSKKWPKVGRNS